MATKVIFITSLVEGGGYNQPSYSYAYGNIYTLDDAKATIYINSGCAIPFAGWDTNPKAPPRIFNNK
ncbi:hypothetical protein [Fictibacillus sp. S7]|uniref:hypothetical protein n=1 Tax=Fictibacillus sp. S7 TaxID=2212476 RepID=UPI0010105E60|nr:hypothetical protein [Fictibacillus sp. S7]RXY98562.1 hypothetical protein DMO16_02145 [Fictibacillus sp. S7]